MANIGSYPRQGGSNIGPNQRNAVAVTEMHMAVRQKLSTDDRVAGQPQLQDWIVPGFGDVSGYVIWLSNAEENETVKLHARLSVGVHDMTDAYCVSMQSQHNASTTQASSAAGKTGIVGLLIKNDGSGLGMQINHGTAITDGIRLEYITELPTEYAKLVNVALLGGSDASFETFEVAMHATQNSSNATGTIGFTPEQGIVASCQVAPNATPSVTDHARIHLGFFDSDGGSPIAQGGFSWHDRDAASGPSIGTQRAGAGSDEAVIQSFTATEGDDGAAQVSITGTPTLSFKTINAASSGPSIIGITWNTGGLDHGLLQLDALTATGIQTTTVPNTTPLGAFQIACKDDTALPTGVLVTDKASAIGFGAFGPTGDMEASVSVSAEDGSNPSSTYSIASDDGLYVGNVAGGDFMHASILNDLSGGTGEGWQATGWKSDWGNVLSNANHVWYLWFGEPSAGLFVALAEAVGVTEELRQAHLVALAEAVGVTEANTQAHLVALAEPVGVTEELVQAMFMALAESVGVTEATGQSKVVALAEAVGITEEAVQAHLVALAESVGVTEEVVQHHLVALAESVGVTEEVVQAVWVALAESVGVTESNGAARFAEITEAVGVTEEAAGVILTGLVRLAADTLELTEGVPFYTGLVRLLADTLNLTESAIHASGMVRLSADSIEFTEGAPYYTGLVRQAADALDLTEGAFHVEARAMFTQGWPAGVVACGGGILGYVATEQS